MRTSVVLDTNVLLDLYVYQDPRTAVLRQAIDRNALDLPACDQTLAELADVLARQKFGLSLQRQQEILAHWRAVSRPMSQPELVHSAWRCRDKADQVFLDMAWTCRPCMLVSKDLAVLRFAKRAAKEGVLILAAFQWPDGLDGQQAQ